ncbi:MAG: helix-turn-helix transcriptional regulator [Acidobacteriota bacterium]
MTTTTLTGNDLLGRILREARERAGLTQRQLAERMSVSRATIAEAELGCDLRRSTLQRYVDELAALNPHRLLWTRDAALPVSSPAVWRCVRDLAGFQVDRLVRTAFADEPPPASPQLALQGVRSLSGSLKEPAALIALLRAVFRGHPGALREAVESAGELVGETLVFEDDQYRHRFVFPHEIDRLGFDYQRTDLQANPTLDPVTFTPGYPVRRLELVIARSDGELPEHVRYEAHIGGQRALTEDADLALRLRPEGLRNEREELGRRMVLHVERPELYVTHELHWHDVDPSETDEPLAPVTEPPTTTTVAAAGPLGGLLREARERGGLSQRELSRRLGVSAMTVSNAERGRDARCSTLRAYLRELEELSADMLLVGRGPDREATPREVWEHYRNLYGLEATEESKELVIDDEGWAEAVYRTRGLKSLVPRPQGLVVRYGEGALVRRGSDPPQQIEQDGPEHEHDEGFRTRLIRRGEASAIHELAFSPEAARRGVSYTRRVERALSYVVSADQQDSEDLRDGHSFTAAFPVRRLVVGVRFPSGFWPGGLQAHSWPTFRLPAPHGEELSARLHPRRLRLVTSRRERRVTLTIEEPLIGIHYGISWLGPGG